MEIRRGCVLKGKNETKSFAGMVVSEEREAND